jgi:hypothetical protein
MLGRARTGRVIAAAVAATAAAAVGLSAAAGGALLQQHELTDPGSGAKDEYGYAIAAGTDTLVITACSEGTPGIAYVYTKPAAGWDALGAPVAELSDGQTGEGFGCGVAIDPAGDTIAVGAFDANGGGGAVYVFERHGASWTSSTAPDATLTQTSPGPEDFVGSHLVISSDGATILSGAANRDVGGHSAAGAVYVWARDSTDWMTTTQTATLTASTPHANAGLGDSVALSSDGNTLVAAAGGGTGGAYVFKRPDGGWSGSSEHESAILTPSDGVSGDDFGLGLAILDNVIAVGAESHKVGSSGGDQGAAYVFVEPPTGWATRTQTAELTNSPAISSAQLGSSVALADGGNTLYTGAPDNTSPAFERGTVAVFQAPPGGWAALPSGAGNQTESLTATDGAIGDSFGTQVLPLPSASVPGGAALAIGAPFMKISGQTKSGRAYIFDFPAPAITITRPAEGATYTQGATEHAAYACTVTGSTISACTGGTANGARVDTHGLGRHTLTVTATTADGATATKTVTYTVVAPTPTVTGFKQSHKSWRLGSKLAKESRARRRKPAVGTKFTFKLNVAARVTLTFKPRHGKPSLLTFNAKAGSRKVSFDGRISKKTKLKPGRYLVTITASANGKRSAAHSLGCTIAS